METHSVQLGSVMLHGYADAPDPFVGLAVTAVNGWRGLSGARGDGDAIPGAHGSYGATRVLREGRSIEVRGAAIAESEQAAEALLELLEAEVADRPVTMWVNDAQGAYSRVVEVESVQVIGAYNRDRIVFAIDAFAPNPRRYRAPEIRGPIGLPTQDGGLILPKAFPWDFGTSVLQRIDVVNDGTIRVYPRITLQGSAASVSVSAGPNSLQFGAFSGTLIFDSLERRAWLNGGDVTGEMLRREWPSINSGSSAAFTFDAVEPSADISLMVEYRIGAM